jgi:hypothetical protein
VATDDKEKTSKEPDKKDSKTQDKEKTSIRTSKKESKTQDQETKSKGTDKKESKTNDQVGTKPDDGKQKETDKVTDENKSKEALKQADVVAVD